jgi:methylmalonyl-CoA carboxyltransferase 1.3S subunit
VKLQVAIGGEVYEVEVEDTEDDFLPGAATADIQSMVLPGPGCKAADGADGKICRSPIAGIVARVNVESGQEVEVDDVLLVLEAMKMETNISATTAGKLKCIRVAQGDAVKTSQVLLEFE